MCECAIATERMKEEKSIKYIRYIYNYILNMYEVDNQFSNHFSLSGYCCRQLLQTLASCDMHIVLLNTPHSKTQEDRGSSTEAAVCVHDYY